MVLIEGEDSVGSIEWNSKFPIAIGSSHHHVVQPLQSNKIKIIPSFTYFPDRNVLWRYFDMPGRKRTERWISNMNIEHALQEYSRCLQFSRSLFLFERRNKQIWNNVWKWMRDWDEFNKQRENRSRNKCYAMKTF